MQTETKKTETKKAVITKPAKTAATKTVIKGLFAVVHVDENYAIDAAPAGEIALRFIHATLKSELSEKLNTAGIIEVIRVFRGRQVDFNEQRKLRFF